MSKGKKKNYDKEFKFNTVKLYLEGERSIAQLSQELGVPITTLGGWVSTYKQEGVESFPGKGYAKPGDEEVRRLRKEVESLRRQRDILKKALTIFSSHAHSDMNS